jgi:1-aminocyclopropane-1-carboxylate deaminase
LNISKEFNVVVENQKIALPVLNECKVELYIKREDQIHKEISGNKFRKLKYNVIEAKNQGKTTLLTFGGAYSNHILAVAAAGHLNNLQTIGIIRGDELAQNLPKVLAENSTLSKAHELGMKFDFISRSNYRMKDSTAFLTQLSNKYDTPYIIPEGGTNQLAIKGCEEILTNEDEKFDYICVPVGTGGTISGIINSVRKGQKVLGFPALKGDFLKDDIQKMVVSSTSWELISKYHFGGYGKYKPELIHFINEFKKNTEILLDPIYTGKMMYGIIDLIRTKVIDEGSKILAIHTGGIQGIEGFNRKLEKKQLERIKV